MTHLKGKRILTIYFDNLFWTWALNMHKTIYNFFSFLQWLAAFCQLSKNRLMILYWISRGKTTHEFKHIDGLLNIELNSLYSIYRFRVIFLIKYLLQYSYVGLNTILFDGCTMTRRRGCVRSCAAAWQSSRSSGRPA